MRDSHMPPSPCPRCGRILDGAMHLDNSTPDPGDITICIECSTLSVFDDKLHLREPTDEEMADMLAHPHPDLKLVLDITSLWRKEKAHGRG
jgi:hypothetical protein